MQPADDVHLAQLEAASLHNLVDGQLIGVGPSALRGEVAEPTGEHADVRGVDLPVDHEVGVITPSRALDLVGQPAYRVAKSGIGYVPEDRRIFTDLTVMENLEVGRQPKRKDAPDWTIEQLFEIFPNLAERRGNRGKQMSGGEQQMLTIARTLMGNPALLLLDEPSEGIAPVIVEQMADTILKLKAEGLTVLLVEQNAHRALEARKTTGSTILEP